MPWGIVTLVTLRGLLTGVDGVALGGAIGGFWVVLSAALDAGVSEGENGLAGSLTADIALYSSTPTPVTRPSTRFLIRPRFRGSGRVTIPGLASPLAYFKPSGPARPPAFPREGSITALLVMRVQNPSSSKVKDMA